MAGDGLDQINGDKARHGWTISLRFPDVPAVKRGSSPARPRRWTVMLNILTTSVTPALQFGLCSNEF